MTVQNRIREYVRPASVEEAVAVKAALGTSAFYLAGGTDAVLSRPPGATTAIDIMRLGMDGVETSDGKIVVGATTILRDVERHPAVAAVAGGALSEAIRDTGPWLIRNAATLAGNVGNASPSADSVPMLLALDTEIVLSDGRVLPLDRVFAGPHRTILDNALMVELRIDPRGRRGRFHKLSRSKSDIAQVNLAVAARAEDGRLHDVRIALGSVAPTPLRARKAEDLLEGQAVSEALLEELATSVRSEITPIDDWRATAAYRRHAAGVMAVRAIQSLIEVATLTL